MNFSSSAQELPEWRGPISPFDYRDVAVAMTAVEERIAEAGDASGVEPPPMPPGISAEEVERLVQTARVEAAQQAAESERREYEKRLAEEREKVRCAIEAFGEERKRYIGGVEAEVIKLSLAIAAKILHRESTADPLLVGALVRIALEKLQAGSSVTVRVSAPEKESWERQLQHLSHGIEAQVTGDPHLAPGGCVVVAEVGTADLSIDAQLKEVEQNFLDLLSQRPTTR